MCSVGHTNWSISQGVLAVRHRYSLEAAAATAPHYVFSQYLEDMKEVKVRNRSGEAAA